MTVEAGRRPTHRLCVKEKNGKGTTLVGAGWEDADGHISIRLNPCVVLSFADDVIITLFPIEKGRDV